MVTEPVKVCPRCKVRKPWSEFYARSRWEDGTVRTVMAYCRPCNTAKRNEHFRAHPGSKSAAMKRWRDRLLADPERAADYREKQRFYEATSRLRRGGRVGARTLSSPGSVIPSGPFAAWIRTVQVRDEATTRALAERWEISYKTLRCVLNGERDIRESVVERALLADDTITLRDLYPDI